MAQKILKLFGRLGRMSWRNFFLFVVPVIAAAVALAVAVAWLRPAPPDVIRLLSGPEGSVYQTNAQKYKDLIEPYGVRVQIIPSRGALDNLEHLANPKAKVDVGFVQGGLAEGVDTSRLVSLGSLFPQPLLVYYHSASRVTRLSELTGKRIAIGPEGSGTRAIGLKVLKASNMDGAPTQLSPLGGEEAAAALTAGTVDAIFLSGEMVSLQGLLTNLRAHPGLELMNFRQANAYVRKFRFLTRLELPEGAMDLAANYPPETYDLIGPTVELVARNDLHPALSDLLIEAARKVHGTPGLFRDPGQYPAPLAREFTISKDAERFYKSGGHFLYQRLPLWLASLVDRLLVVILPLLVVIVPATRIGPPLYRWRVRSRIYRWYGSLMTMERTISQGLDQTARADLEKELSEMERAIAIQKTPLSYADEVFDLRAHIQLVRARLAQSTPPAQPTS